MSELKRKLKTYFIMGSQNCRQDPVKILREAISGGITAFQFREKGAGSLTGQAKLDLGFALRELCRENEVLFIVNDDVELVEPLDADGIHVGQDDISVYHLRKQFPHKMIGLSVSNQKELEQSPLHLVDYVGAGPVFTTYTKEDAKSAVGITWIKTLRKQLLSMPIVGIGGINVSNAKSVIQAGADGVSLISAITNAKDVKTVVAQLNQIHEKKTGEI